MGVAGRLLSVQPRRGASVAVVGAIPTAIAAAVEGTVTYTGTLLGPIPVPEAGAHCPLNVERAAVHANHAHI